MDLALSEEQEMLKKTARDFLTNKCPKSLVREMQDDENGYSPQLWQEMAELGWMGLIFPEKYGGSGMSFLDLAVLLEEMGRACLPGPFISTVLLGGLPILDIGDEAQKQEYLPKIATGKAIFTLALTEPSARYDADAIAVSATADHDTYSISGTKLFVPDAHIADYLLCIARTGEQTKAEDGITIFLTDTKNSDITRKPLRSSYGDRPCEVVFNKVRVPKKNILGRLNRGWDEVQRTIELAALAKCCEMVGGMQQVLEMTVDYAKQRSQFDHPIGSFEVIQFYCSNMLEDVDTSRAITYEAAWLLSEGRPYTKEVALAKAWVSEAYRRVVFLGHQVNGGVGLMTDHDMPLYFQQSKAAELAFGDARYHRKKLAREMGFEL
jgi:alkylation response protein AidB-like acyl-CoA dehydrogenase